MGITTTTLMAKKTGGRDYLSEREVKYYLCHLLIALDVLHAAGIMHRDVKPRRSHQRG
jgi:serine/threonine protein kinase